MFSVFLCGALCQCCAAKVWSCSGRHLIIHSLWLPLFFVWPCQDPQDATHHIYACLLRKLLGQFSTVLPTHSVLYTAALAGPLAAASLKLSWQKRTSFSPWTFTSRVSGCHIPVRCPANRQQQVNVIKKEGDEKRWLTGFRFVKRLGDSGTEMNFLGHNRHFCNGLTLCFCFWFSLDKEQLFCWIPVALLL